MSNVLSTGSLKMKNSPEQPRPSLQQSLNDFLIHLTVERCLAKNTLLAYRRDLEKLVGFLASKNITHPESITSSLITEFLGYLTSQNLAQPSVARAAAAVKTFLTYLFHDGKLKTDPNTLMDTPKPAYKLPKVLSRVQIDTLLKVVPPNDELVLRDRAILEMFYACGLRVSELCGLTLSDVEMIRSAGVLRCIGKGRKERVIPVGKPAMEAVRKYLTILRPILVGDKKTLNLFVSRRGEPLDRENVWRMVKKYAVLAGFSPSKVSPHTLRHSFASHLLEGGADLRVLQELLGHSNVVTTQIYTHIDQRRLKGIHRKFHPRP
jgi:integrase/recombinase XerD